MPIVSIDPRMRQIGRIRMGAQVEARNAKGEIVHRPSQLETFRLTSPTREPLDAAAPVYGGEPKEWTHPASDDRYELLTTTDTLDIMLVPSDAAFSQYYELWSGDGCQRRCDGEVNTLTGERCLCEQGEERECSPVTRWSVMLARLPGIGLWRFESHGYFAARELAGTYEVVRQARGLIPARLRIEARSTKKAGEKPRYFSVPVVEFGFTPEALMSGRVALSIEPAKDPVPELSRQVPAEAEAAAGLGPPAAPGPQDPDGAAPAPTGSADPAPAAPSGPAKPSERWMADFAKQCEEWTDDQVVAIVTYATNGDVTDPEELLARDTRAVKETVAGLKEGRLRFVEGVWFNPDGSEQHVRVEEARTEGDLPPAVQQQIMDDQAARPF